MIRGEGAGLPRFVAFFGPDGAGKTTHVRELSDYYAVNGYRVRRAWIRANHSVAFLLSRILVRLGYYRTEGNPLATGKGEARLARVFRVATIPSLRSLWAWVEFFSVVPLILARVYLPLVLGYAVIAERYVFDSVVAISYILGDRSFIGRWQSRALLGMVPANALLVYLRASYPTILLRRRHLAEGPEFIEHQIREYDRLAAEWGCPVISTEARSVPETQGLIRSLVVSHRDKLR